MESCFILMSYSGAYISYVLIYICLTYLCKDENAQSLHLSNQLVVYDSEATEIFI